MLELAFKKSNSTTLVRPWLKGLLQFAVLLSIVLWVNFPIITSSFFYPEQPTIYFANQKIHTLHDLINVYLHPQWLQLEIPFFRPSGHFLIYQIIAPLLGWHNTHALIIINLIFLALTGSLLIANYKLLFPKFAVGGYIAFAIYLMHPALTLSRFTALHFEFASTFFLMLGLYFFLLFCRNNLANKQINLQTVTFKYFYLLAFALCFYTIAITFKETAIILGPMLMSYFIIVLYQQQNPVTFLLTSIKNKEITKILILLGAVTAVLAIYLTLPWPTLVHPLRPVVVTNSLGAINELINAFLGTNKIYFKNGFLVGATLVWRNITFPTNIFYVMQIFIFILLISSVFLFLNKSAALTFYKKSFLFLLVSFCCSLILPITWAVGAPWHLVFSVLFFSMLAGFSVEYLGRKFSRNQFYFSVASMLCALLVASMAIKMNIANLQLFKEKKEITFAMSLNQNAVAHPLPLKDQLDENSLLIVEDSILHNDYSLGNAAYPLLLFMNDKDFSAFTHNQNLYFLKFNLNYSGNLFRWAYLMPQLHEELYPFRIDAMYEVPNEVIYDWLIHYRNIFCVGYDEKAHWFDRTAKFKENLLRERNRRSIIVNDYQQIANVTFSSPILRKKELNVPDENLCRYTCDQEQQCQGFTYRDIGFDRKVCELHHIVDKTKQLPCRFCTSFTKLRQS